MGRKQNMMKQRSVLVSGVFLVLVLGLFFSRVANVFSQDGTQSDGDRPAPPAQAAGEGAGGTGGGAVDAPFVEITPEMQESVRKGLEWLAKTQELVKGSDRNVIGGFWGGKSAPVAITSLACLAFMADGSLPGKGRFGTEVELGLRYILSHSQKTTGYITDKERGDGGSGMHGHGYATLFLAEVYGMSAGLELGTYVGADRDELKKRIVKAIEVIENSQSKEGGWYYLPNSQSDEGSVTVTQVQALRAARNAGIHVSADVIENAVDYINKSSNPNGSVKYSLRHSTGSGSFALAAAGVSILDFLGEYKNERVERGLNFVKNFKPGNADKVTSWYFYGHFYAAVAMFQAQGEWWEDWFPAIREELIESQRETGEWDSPRYGGAYSTSFACLILQLPNRYLPIFQD